MKRIVIYGGDFPAIASAEKATSTEVTATIHLIIPYVLYKLGGIALVGGQNYSDYVSPFTKQGTFGCMIDFGIGYNTDNLLQDFLLQYQWSLDTVALHLLVQIGSGQLLF